jgi:hypothetical protein
MKDIIRMNQLAGIITESQARKMMEVLYENENYELGDPRYGTDDPRSLDELEKVILKHMKVKERGDGNIKVNNEINIVYSIYKNKGGKKTKKTLEAIARK